MNKSDIWMHWFVDNTDPFEYYREKYGEPRYIKIGKGVNIIVPDGITILNEKAPDKCVLIKGE